LLNGADRHTANSLGEVINRKKQTLNYLKKTAVYTDDNSYIRSHNIENSKNKKSCCKTTLLCANCGVDEGKC